jgi:hypothetical protein
MPNKAPDVSDDAVSFNSRILAQFHKIVSEAIVTLTCR